MAICEVGTTLTLNSTDADTPGAVPRRAVMPTTSRSHGATNFWAMLPAAYDAR
jgi:hypothetical protein